MFYILISLGVLHLIAGSLIYFFPLATKRLLKQWFEISERKFYIFVETILTSGLLLIYLALIYRNR